MTINFQHIPSNIRVPLFYAEVNNQNANTAQLNYRALIIAQMLSTGSATSGTAVLTGTSGDGITKFGLGSMASLMVNAYRAADSFGELWVLPLSDNGSGVAATGNITFTSAATANGTLALYVAGVAVPVPISSASSNAQNASAVVAAINANTSLPVTATVDGSNTAKVDLLARNAGLGGNDIDVRVNYYGAPNGEYTPTGLAFTFSNAVGSGMLLSGGATNPVIATALASLATQKYDVIISAYTDATSFTALSAYLNDSVGTWSYAEQLYGHAWYGYRGNFSALTTFGTAKNDQHSTVIGFYDSPTPAWILAADAGATALTSLRNDPAQPLQTLPLSTFLSPPLASLFPLTERNTLLFDGISTFNVVAGHPILENIITTYQLNAFGQPDNSYLEVETMYTLAFVLQTLNSIITSRYPRMKLAADGTKFAAGSNIVTPSIIKSDIIAEYKNLEFNGLVQGSDYFAANVIVQQNTTNPNRVDVLYPAVLIDQLRIFALLMQFQNIVPAAA